MTTGERIQAARKGQGLTQKALSERCGIAEPTIRQYESGRLNPKIETLDKLAAALGVPINDLKPDITQGQIGCMELLKKFNKPPIGFEAVIEFLTGIYGRVEEKYATRIFENEGGGKSHTFKSYWLIGKGEDAFILYEHNIKAISDSIMGMLPPIVGQLKETRPEKEVYEQFIAEINKEGDADAEKD